MSAAYHLGVAGRVLEHAQAHGDRIAVIAGGLQLSYGELASEVLLTSERLRASGVRPHDAVGIAMPRSVESLIAVLSCQHLGASFVPFDADLPSARLATMHDAASPTLVLLRASASAPSWALSSKCLAWDELQSLVVDGGSPKCDGAGATPRSSDDLAYVIFTSGSTGQPKGAQISFGNLSVLMRSWDEVVKLSKHITLWLSAATFDASITEFLWTMHAGGTLVIAPTEGDISVGSLIRTHRITHMQCTPTRATMLLADPIDRSALPELEHLVVGGEPLPSALARELIVAGVRQLTNAYGPTETTVWATSFGVTPEWLATTELGTVPIGTAIPHATLTIVDAANQPVGHGEVGEIRIDGDLVGLGYRNNPDLTNYVFGEVGAEVGADNSRTYRTGDLGRWNEQGLLEFHGRADHQVKLRGHRIELGEIESALVAHPLVKLAVVELDRRHVGAGEAPQDLVAAVVSLHRTGQPQCGESSRLSDPELVTELGTHLRGVLPAIMVPRSIVVFDQLPTTTSGKLDRTEIRSMLGRERIKPIAAAGDAAKQFSVETVIEEFRLVLPHQLGMTLDAHSDFFATGGHSLMVVELMSRIQRRTGTALPLSCILGAPTPQLLFEALEHATASEFNPLISLAPVEDDAGAPQRPLLFFVHGAGGHVLRFRQMAYAMRREVEVIGVQAIGVDGDDRADTTLNDMVDRYVKAIQTSTTSRPIHLGGYSAGGVIAIHIADRLLRDGHDVRSLSLCDTFDPLPFPEGLSARLRAIVFNATHRDGLGLRQWVTGSVDGWRRRRDWDAEGAAALTRVGYNDLFDAIADKIHSAPPPPAVHLPALVVRAYAENPIRLRDYSAAYSSTGSVTTRWVPVKHDELFTDERSAEIAEHISGFIKMYS
jgi:amino acid adenylation domain-containing protein